MHSSKIIKACIVKGRYRMENADSNCMEWGIIFSKYKKAYNRTRRLKAKCNRENNSYEPHHSMIGVNI